MVKGVDEQVAEEGIWTYLLETLHNEEYNNFYSSTDIENVFYEVQVRRSCRSRKTQRKIRKGV